MYRITPQDTNFFCFLFEKLRLTSDAWETEMNKNLHVNWTKQNKHHPQGSVITLVIGINDFLPFPIYNQFVSKCLKKQPMPKEGDGWFNAA